MKKIGGLHLLALLGATVGALTLSGCCTDVENKLNSCVDRLAKHQSATARERDKGVLLAKALADATKQLNKRDEQIVFLTKRLEALGQKVGAVQSLSAAERMEMARKLEEIRRKLAHLELERQKALARMEKLRALLRKFAALIKSGKIKVLVRDGRMVVVLASKVLFDSGRTLVKPAGKKAIAEIVVVLKSVHDRKFQVAGHTDNTPIRWGRYRNNWALSTARAVAVVQLMQKMGMPTKQLSAAGYGEYSPVKPNTTPDNKGENRRIEIVLQPKLDELPNLKGLFE